MPSERWDELEAAMPESVRGVLLPWEWSRERLWALPLPTTRLSLTALAHVMDAPLWRDEAGTPFALRPRDVLAAPERHPTQFGRVVAADLAFPVHVTKWGERYVVLDGVHRVAKAAVLGWREIAAHDVPERLYGAFAVMPRAERLAPVRAPD